MAFLLNNVALPGYINQIYNTYGDTVLGRRLATEFIINLYQFYYGVAYEYRLASGYYVDSNGHIKLAQIINDAIADQCDINLGTITGNGGLYVIKIKRENPLYIYPTYYEYRVFPYDTTDRFLYNSLGVQNFKYLGCKLSGTGVNIDSTETVDGGPVVKVTAVNQNQIVFSNNNVLTARANTSGLPVRQLTTFRTNSSQGETITNIPSAEQ